MHEIEQAAGDGSPVVKRRWPELLMALVLMGLAVLVIVDSLRVGAGWADDGPRAGYFPFFIGLGLLGAGTAVAVQQLRQWPTSHAAFATRAQLASVATLAVPLLVYAVALKWLGLYACSALLIAWFMVRHGKHPHALTAAVSVGVPLALWLAFERWFMVPLPKGPLERLLGL